MAKKTDDKDRETKKGKATKATKRKKVVKKISYYVKPEKMTLEEWQVALRRQVAREEKYVIKPVDDELLPGEYTVENAKKQTYKVVYRGAKSPWNYCSCMDFKTSGLGTCKHLEALKMWIGNNKHYRVHRELPPYTSVYLSYIGDYKSPQTERQVRIRIGEEHREEYEALASRYFDSDGVITEKGFKDYAQLLVEGRKISDSFRFYDDAIDFIVEKRERRLREKIIANYSDADLDGLLSVTLYPYQREGVRFAFTTGKSIIADEMGLGKTIQAIATAELLRKERLVSSVLIVCPTSLKYQWKREIERFVGTRTAADAMHGVPAGRTGMSTLPGAGETTALPEEQPLALVIEGGHLQRKVQYGKDVFYKIVSYNSMCNDVKILGSLQTDLLIMDEVQRLKNWNTQISQAARRISSNYSVVLSGTPLENRLEELYSVMEFADQWCLGPYYQFKDSCIECDETGKVIGYKNLNRVGEQIRLHLIRRTKKGVALQMPKRQDKNLIVPMTKEQMGIHGECEFQVSILVKKWRDHHFLSETDRLRLLKLLSQQRMVCDSTYILDQKTRKDTKVDETMNILLDIFSQDDAEKVVIFSQWERMTRLIAQELTERGIGFANLHGGVPSRQRADLIKNFWDDPDCRVFLSTDAGSTGLNLQVAATIINLDLPWNPAVLEQRIARIYRLGQQRPVQVINLVSARTIEEDMIGKLRFKTAMFEGVLDGGDDCVFLGDKSRFEQMMESLSEVFDEEAAQPETELETIDAEEQEVAATEPLPTESGDMAEEDTSSDTASTPAIDGEPQRQGTFFDKGSVRADDLDKPSGKTERPVIPKPADTPEELVTQGISFLSGLAQTLQSPEATERLVNTLVETDEQTGESTLRIPVPDKQTVTSLLSLVGNLMKLLSVIMLALVTATGWAQTKVWNEVVTGYANTPVIEVRKVAMYSDRTEISVHIDFRKGQWIAIAPNTLVRADGKDYGVKDATVLKLGERFTMPEDTLNFVLTFEPVPPTTKTLDLMEPNGWLVTNIRSVDELPEGLDNTYWRDEATGEWLIGFAPNHVIYQNKVLDIVKRTEKKGGYEMTLGDGTVIKVGKMKSRDATCRVRQGFRTITIGNGKPVACSMIVRPTLPDYPTKDSRTGFTDNGYNATDSVTIIGWLKDMPEQAWKKGREFQVGYENIIADNQESAFAKMDSLGRFTLTMPLLNTSQVFLDWGRTTKSTVLEPGKTYFFLNDFNTGHTLWMGDDVRVQNELLAYPHAWPNDRIEHEDEGRVSAMQFKALTDSTRAANMAKLQECTNQHPTISQRYIDYVTGYYLTAQGESMMQARFSIPARKLPQEYMDYVGQELWSNTVRPYTLYRDFGTFMRDYLDQLHDSHQRNSGEETVKAIRKLEQEGVATLTADEQEALNVYVPMLNELEAKLQNAKGGTVIDSLVDAFNTHPTVEKVYNLFNRIGDPIRNMLATTELRVNLALIDSVGCDRNLRDIYLARYLYKQIDITRKPLDPALLAFAEQNIQLPAALTTLKTLNDKYLAINRRDITKSPSLKTADDVANMTDGEQMLRKICEPYKGRLILLDVWGTWCGPCKQMLAHSHEEYQRLKDYGLVYLYLCNRSSDESWKNVIKEYNVLGDNVVHYNLPEDQQTAIEHFLHVQHFPTYRLIDRDGTVLDVNADPRDLEGLARLLEQMKQ